MAEFFVFFVLHALSQGVEFVLLLQQVRVRLKQHGQAVAAAPLWLAELLVWVSVGCAAAAHASEAELAAEASGGVGKRFTADGTAFV